MWRITGGTTHKRVDKRFDEIVMYDLKLKIAEAFLDLEKELRVLDYRIRNIEKVEHEEIRKKANQMKEELISFIDSQVDRIIGASNIQVHSENPEIE